jgi:hypothetical protein
MRLAAWRYRGSRAGSSLAGRRLTVFSNRCRVPECCLVRWGRQRRDGLSNLGHVAGGADAGKPCTSDSVAPGWFCLIDEGRGADLVLGQPDFT